MKNSSKIVPTFTLSELLKHMPGPRTEEDQKMATAYVEEISAHLTAIEIEISSRLAANIPGENGRHDEYALDRSIFDDSESFLAAAAPSGKEKSRALPQSGQAKRPLGEAKGSKGKCSFFAVGDAVFVGFDEEHAPTRILLPGLTTETYALSSEADADGHYGIVGISAAGIAQFLMLRRKPHW